MATTPTISAPRTLEDLEAPAPDFTEDLSSQSLKLAEFAEDIRRQMQIFAFNGINHTSLVPEGGVDD